MAEVPGAIMPFPGGITRSGSKVGSKYKALPASTNHAYCPTLRGAGGTALDPDTAAVLEIVIDGLTPAAVADAMRAGLKAAVALGPEQGAARIGAGQLRRQARPPPFPSAGADLMAMGQRHQASSLGEGR